MHVFSQGKSRVPTLAAVALGVAGFACSTAQAAPIAGVNSLQDLINLNQGDPQDGIPQGGINVGGIQFYDFQYSNTGPNSPAPAQIDVETAPGPVGSEGLEFSFDWVSAGGDNMVSTIRYKVASQVPLNQVGAFFDGTVPTGFSGIGTFAQVTETVRTLGGTVLGVLGLFNDGTGPGADIQAATLTLAPPQTNLDVSKAIRVHSTGSGTATISVVDNTFRPIPEPTAIGLAAFGAGLTLLRRRRRA